MDQTDAAALAGPMKLTATVAKFAGDATDQPPYETVTVAVWQEADGTPIADPARVAALEAALAERSEDRCP